MKIEKRKGGYRVQPMRKGKRYSLTFDHKPTKSDIEDALMDAIAKENAENGCDMTFETAAKKYAESKKNVLSPSTYREYTNTPSRLPEWFVKMKIAEIEQNDINKVINELALNKKPKTVRNYHGFISSVLGTFKPELNISTHLPQKVKNEPYIPSDDDVKRILDYAKGSQFETALVLMAYGMRRSEVLAITGDDIEGDVLHINKAVVRNVDKEYVVKTTKTTSSTRDIIIPKDIADKIKEQGYAYKGHENSITDYLYKVQKRLDIPKFSAHKLRHYFASKMSALGVADVDIMALGGWETDNVMKTVYRHSMQKDEQKRKAADMLKKAIL